MPSQSSSPRSFARTNRRHPVARYAVLASAFAMACCSAPEPPAPTPPPVVIRPAPTPTPPPVVQEPQYANWLDAPRTPGAWQYRAGTGTTMAVYVEAGGRESFAIVCQGDITLSRAGRASSAVPMEITTETGNRIFNAAPSTNGNSFLNISLPAQTRLLDAMALSRGRFMVQTSGLRTLYLPAWAEVSRVIEDCR